mmetsp:Transcript_69505/g.207088  ORF Transcript_69505/g.207088 Transcript_69505/m.207088 type:complete len:247 (+) Transcript_69505:1974-2714(+)
MREASLTSFSGLPASSRRAGSLREEPLNAKSQPLSSYSMSGSAAMPEYRFRMCFGALVSMKSFAPRTFRRARSPRTSAWQRQVNTVGTDANRRPSRHGAQRATTGAPRVPRPVFMQKTSLGSGSASENHSASRVRAWTRTLEPQGHSPWSRSSETRKSCSLPPASRAPASSKYPFWARGPSTASLAPRTQTARLGVRARCPAALPYLCRVSASASSSVLSSASAKATVRGPEHLRRSRGGSARWWR